MPRLELKDSLLEILTKMGEGNPGAIRVISEVLKLGNLYDPYVPSAMYFVQLDIIGYYGSAIWELYKDVCGESIPRLLTYLRGTQLGLIKPFGYMEESLDFDKLLIGIQEKLPRFLEGGFDADTKV